MQAAWRCVERVSGVMRAGQPCALAALESELESFPHGVDPALERRWLTNAIDYEALGAIEWMIERQVDLSYIDEEGFTPITSALQIENEVTRHAVLRLLLHAGARHDLIAADGGTAAHFAANRGDVEALRILAEFGADLCAATEDLGSWKTPADVARYHKHAQALEYLEKLCSGVDRRRDRSNI
ncbi:MAG: ankyrin repeat domain-containing protein [Ramlibacter sp.]